MIASHLCLPYDYGVLGNSTLRDPVLPTSGGESTDGEIPYTLEYTINSAWSSDGFTLGWNGFGTSAPDLTVTTIKPVENTRYDGEYIVDVTIVSEIARRTLERFKFGAARITIRTTIDHFDLEVGDVVSLGSDDVFLSPLVDGASDAVTFEIVMKRCRFFEDTPSMEFDLVMLKAEAQDVIDTSYVFPIFPLIVVPAATGDEIVTNAGDPVWSDNDGDGAIEPGDDVLYRG